MFEVNDSGKLPSSRELVLLLKRIQTQGNEDIKYQTDLKTYRSAEVWNYPVLVDGTHLVGDCEDITLYKRRLLVEAGIPAEALVVTICADPSSNGHCVLSVLTDKRDYILCNNHKDIATVMEMRHEGYKFLYRQRPGHKLDEPFEVLK